MTLVFSYFKLCLSRLAFTANTMTRSSSPKIPNIMKSSELVILVHPILRGKEERDGKKKEKVEGKSNRYNK